MPTNYRHVARKALETNQCMGNPEIGAPGCHRPTAEGRRHGRCELCQDIWNLWRRERRAGWRAAGLARAQARQDALFALLGTLRGKRQQLAFWVLWRLGYKLDERSYLTMNSPVERPRYESAPTMYAAERIFPNAASMDEAGKL